jgi:CD2 antigen cytoplasmic tail-binding protein 2
MVKTKMNLVLELDVPTLSLLMKNKLQDQDHQSKKRYKEEEGEELESVKQRRGAVDALVYQSDDEVDDISDSDNEQLPTTRQKPNENDIFQSEPSAKTFMESADFEGQEWSCAEFTLEEQGEQVESFNMEKELEEGQFTESGVYILKKDEYAIHDRWLEGVTKQDIEKAREAHALLQQKPEIDDWSAELGWKEIVQLLEPKESLLKAIQRLGGLCAVVPKWKKVKTKSLLTNEQKQEYKVALDQLTSHASKLLFTDPDVYERTFEEIVFMLKAQNVIDKEWEYGHSI